MSPPVAIVGGGSFGRGLALASARVKRRVLLWSRSDRALDEERVTVTHDLSDVRSAELVFIAVPSVHVRDIARQIGHFVDGSHLLVHVSRGLVGDDLETLTHVLGIETPSRRLGVLAGPLVAKSLTEGQPGGGLVGSLFPEVAEAVRDAIGGPTLRIYDTDDVMGVEIASAYVGLVSLALGYAQEKGFGPGTAAVLATRGIAEATRLGLYLGANERTFAGLAGFGDLLAAVAGDGRPEVELGRALARGTPLAQAAAETSAYVEGVLIARQIDDFAHRYGISTPIASAMAKLLGGKDTDAVVRELMTRPTGAE
jgi:glycerol-3-phosphate dehydrogenase (NAD(P)+)